MTSTVRTTAQTLTLLESGFTLRPGTDRVDAKAPGPKEIYSNKNGKWSVLGLAGGAWGVLIEKEGFMPSEGQVKVIEAGFGPAQPIVVTLKVPPKEVQQAQQKQSGNALAKAAIEQGNVDLQASKFAEARAQYEKALSLLEVDDPALKASIERTIAKTYYEDKQPAKAIETLKKALETAPNDQESLQLIVNLLVAQNREEEAKVYMAKLPQGAKVDPNTRLNLGIKAYNEKKLPEALQYFNQVVTENPDLAEAYYFRGLVYLNLNKTAEAKADFQKLLALDPNSKYANDAKEFLKSI